MSQRLILFSKRPILGTVKTRMVPPLTERQALGLHRALLRDALEMIRRLTGPLRSSEWRLDAPWVPDKELAGASESMDLASQGPGDLGDRLIRAFRDSRVSHHTATVVIGSDSPTLPTATVERAFTELQQGAGAVVSPAEDGGYVLLGLREPVPELFVDVPWGRDDVLEATRRGARRAGVELLELPGWYDVDVAADVRRLAGDLTDPESAGRAPSTSRFLESLARVPGLWT